MLKHHPELNCVSYTNEDFDPALAKWKAGHRDFSSDERAMLYGGIHWMLEDLAEDGKQFSEEGKALQAILDELDELGEPQSGPAPTAH